MKERKNSFANLLMFFAMSILLVMISSMNVRAAESSNWAWPTSVTTIKSDWPNYSDGDYHGGTDFPVALNSPVYSTCDGEVVAVKSLTTSYGKHIKIKATVNGETVYIRYCHLNSYIVKKGDKVAAGQLIGYSGSTGNSTGPHLHYEVRDANDTRGYGSNPNLNPKNYLPGTTYTYTALFLNLNQESLSIYPNESATLTATQSPVTWSSSDTTVAVVDSKGKVTGVVESTGGASSGTTRTATITAKTSDGLTASCTVTVKAATIKLNKSSKTLYTDETVKLTATVKGGSKTVRWSSSNTKVATVSSSGEVSAIKAGTATITAKANGVSATCKVTVKTAPLKLNKTSATLYVDQTLKLTATKNGTTNAVKWKSSNASVATVSNSGKITAKKAGIIVITATVDDFSVKCNLTVKAPTTTLNKSSATIYKSQTLQLNATVKGASSKVTWTSSDKTVATVSSSGKVTAKKAGTATITAKANGKSAKCKITVKTPTTTLNKSSATLYKSQTLQLNATVKGASSTVAWSSSNTSVATVSSSGKVTAKKAGTATITAKANGISAKCKVTVKDPATTLNKASATLEVGDTLILTVTIKGASSTVTWSSSDTSVATVSSSGTVTAKKAGTATITAKANGISAQCKVTVKNSLTADIPDDAVSYNGHFYYIYEVQTSLEDAESKCEKAGGHLVTITSLGEQDTVSSLVAGVSGCLFIGAQKSDDTWQWITGETWLYTNWASGEPNQQNPPEETVVIKSNGYWYDHNQNGTYKNEVIGYICEWD
ncbi:MAG: Ig-like domain-containing protein [Clostridiales bacterium]|nr:Ig-like domain-containing protein [Clostridiales bacterium]